LENPLDLRRTIQHIVAILVGSSLSSDLSVGWCWLLGLFGTLLVDKICDPGKEFLGDDDASVDAGLCSWNVTSLVRTSSLLQLLRKHTGNILSLLLSQSSSKLLLGNKEIGNLSSWLLYKWELFVDLTKLGVGEIIDLGDDWSGNVIGLVEERSEWLEETESLLRVGESVLSESKGLSVVEGIANDWVGGDVRDGFGERVMNWRFGGGHCKKY